MERLQPSALLTFCAVKGEPDVSALSLICLKKGIPVAYPVCDIKTKTMVFRRISGLDDLQKGAYGIFEPSSDCPLFIPDRNALCLVPGLAFDKCGNRMGNGMGYYDKYLSLYPMHTAGLCYHRFITGQLPVQPWDVPVEWVICEK